MKQKVSDMLSVLPREMRAIRERENLMLEKERVIEDHSIVVDAKKGLDIHVPMSSNVDFTKLKGLIDIHVHFHEK